MAQCNAKTKDGRLCQIPAQDSQRYCHVHRRQRLIRNVLSFSALGALLLGTVGLIANIMGILGYFGLNPEPSPLPTPTIVSNTSIAPTELTSTASPPLATTPKLSVEPLLVLNEVFSNSMGCTNGDLWVLPSDSKDSSKIGVGKRFDPSAIRDLVIVGPLMAYIKIDNLQTTGKEITVTDIAVNVTSYIPSDIEVLLIGRSTICADPYIPVTKHQFYSRVKANTGALSLTRPKETDPTPKLFSIDTQSPLVFGMHLNAVEPGWYEIKLILSYTYDGVEESTITDNAIVMYIPDQDEIAEIYVADDFENGTIKVFNDATTLLQNLKTIREKRVIITSLESSLTNPAITGEYLRIQNLGKQQDLTGWKIETLFTDGQTFVFPNFTLPEWASVRIWSGQGNDSPRDLYWNLDRIIWGVTNKPGLPPPTFYLNDASGNTFSGFSYYINPLGETSSDATMLPPKNILYRVIHVSSNDVLNIRAGAGATYEVIGSIPPDGQDIEILGDGVQASNATWVPILYNGITGWVNIYYLTKQ
jgi:hypothetical protein